MHSGRMFSLTIFNIRDAINTKPKTIFNGETQTVHTFSGDFPL